MKTTYEFYNEYGDLNRRAEYICDTVVERLEENLAVSDDYDVAWESNHEYEITDKPSRLMSIDSIGVAVNLNRIYMRIPDLLLRQMPDDLLCDLMTYLSVQSVSALSEELPYVLEFTEDFAHDFKEPSMEVREFLYGDLYRMYDNRLRILSYSNCCFRHYMIADMEYRLGVLVGVEMLRILDQLGDSDDWIIADAAPYDSTVWHTMSKYRVQLNPTYLKNEVEVRRVLEGLITDVYRNEKRLDDMLHRNGPSNEERWAYANMMIDGVFKAKE